MLLSNYENLILNQNIYIKSYIVQNFDKLLTLNTESKSYNFKLLKTFKYIFLKKHQLKKKKNLKKKLIILNLLSHKNVFLMNTTKLYNFNIIKHVNNYKFEDLYINFIKKIILFSNIKNTNKNILQNSILQYKPINITRYIYNFKRKKFLNLNIYYIKQNEKKKVNNLNIYMLQKEHILKHSNNLLLLVDSLIKKKVYFKILNLLDNKYLFNESNKQSLLKIQNNFSNDIKYIYYLCYIYSFSIKKNN
jgi:hypothetical protein